MAGGGREGSYTRGRMLVEISGDPLAAARRARGQRGAACRALARQLAVCRALGMMACGVNVHGSIVDTLAGR